jgi:phospholipase C
MPSIDYLNQKKYTEIINSAKDKPVPNLKWYTENELKFSLLEIQERGIKPIKCIAL